jgi:hypothetical protein
MRRQAEPILFILLVALLFATACKEKPPDEPEDQSGKISISFVHNLDGSQLRIDTMMYTNTAVNHYMITEVQYFISDVTLYKSDGSAQMIDDWKDIHYVDNDIPSTLQWNVFDNIPAGEYDSLSFVFGITEAKNHSLMYTDPPESLMFWPEYLGGGYHYMKLNGKWLDQDNKMIPFDFHLGIGQTYDNEGNITGFIQNYFTVHLPTSSFTVEKEKTTNIVLVMNIESWFSTPHDYNHNDWGGAIMQNQAAMLLAKENGFDVFTMEATSVK